VSHDLKIYASFIFFGPPELKKNTTELHSYRERKINSLNVWYYTVFNLFFNLSVVHNIKFLFVFYEPFVFMKGNKSQILGKEVIRKIVRPKKKTDLMFFSVL
jgi:hypothetical protein